MPGVAGPPLNLTTKWRYIIFRSWCNKVFFSDLRSWYLCPLHPRWSRPFLGLAEVVRSWDVLIKHVRVEEHICKSVSGRFWRKSWTNICSLGTKFETKICWENTDRFQFSSNYSDITFGSVTCTCLSLSIQSYSGMYVLPEVLRNRNSWHFLGYFENSWSFKVFPRSWQFLGHIKIS